MEKLFVINSFYDPIVYTAKTINVKSSGKLMADIFRNYTNYFKQVAKKYNLITYYIQGSPRPEQLSYELYNNTQLYWLLTMANDVYDPYHDWIKTQEACYESVAQKYPDPENLIAYHLDINGEKYYNLTWYEDEPNVWYDIGDKNRQYPQFKGFLSAVSLYEQAILENEKMREIKIIAPGDVNDFVSDLIALLEKNDATTE